MQTELSFTSSRDVHVTGQAKLVLDYIDEFGSITTWQAIMDLGITRLSRCVHDLKGLGYAIAGEMVKGENRRGDPVSYKKYYYNGDKPTEERGRQVPNRIANKGAKTPETMEEPRHD